MKLGERIAFYRKQKTGDWEAGYGKGYSGNSPHRGADPAAHSGAG